MLRKTLISLFTLSMLVLLCGSVTVTSVQVLDTEERDLDTIQSYNSENEDYLISDVKIRLNDYTSNKEQIKANMTYTFTFAQPTSKLTVETTKHIEEIKRITSDEQNRTITVQTQYQTSNNYNEMFHSTTSLIIPRVRLVTMEDIGWNGHYIPTRLVKYSDYDHKVSEVFTTDSAGSLVTDNTLIINTNQRQPTDFKYGIVSNNTTKHIRISKKANKKDVLEISEVAGTLFELNQFNTTQRINMIYIDDLTSAGYIRHMSDTSSNIYMNSYRSSKYVISHELAHSIQNFNTDGNAYWWVEGGAEYLSALFGKNSGMTNAEAEKYAFSKDWASDHKLNASLINPDTWSNLMEYNRGARLSYIVDMKIREHTNKTILDLIERFNNYDDNINHSVARNIIEDMTTPKFADKYDRLVKQNRSINITETLDTEDYNLPPVQIDKSEVKIIEDDDSE